jgi:hypothetical protein
MQNNQKLVVAVEKSLSKAKTIIPFEKEKNSISEAIKLADRYSDITPEVYIYPIDAMAGFISGKSIKISNFY